MAAWTLLASVLGYILTGFAMTKGLLGTHYLHQITELHIKYLPLLMVVSFSIHTPYAIHLSFKRWGIWNWFTKILLIVVYAAFFFSFLFVDLVYKKPSVNQTKAQTTGIAAYRSDDDDEYEEDDDDDFKTTSLNTAQPTTPGTQVFTATELAKYNGQNGQPAYVAVNGVVYDLSTIFVGGQHEYHFAGKDLTNEFNSQHSLAQIQKYPVVGTIR